MDKILQFFNDFGNLINITLLIAIIGLLFSMSKATLSKKDAEIDLLKASLKEAEKNSIENVSVMIEKLKNYYGRDIKDWYEASIASLEKEMQKATEENEKAFQKKIEEEIAKRNELMSKLENKPDGYPGFERELTISDVCGHYSVTGHNPFTREYNYLGTLKISQKDQTLVADWKIGKSNQSHKGIGVYAGGALAFVFSYKGIRSSEMEYGVVLYKFFSPDAMRGYWTGYGTTNIGFEECRKIEI